MYVDRGGGEGHTESILTTDPEEWSCFGNRFTVEDFDRAESVDLCRRVVDGLIGTDPEFHDAVADLHGETLGCWCRGVTEDDPACHDDILVEWADELAGEDDE